MRGALNRRRLLGLGAGVVAAAGCRRVQQTGGAWVWRRLPDLPLGLGGQFAGVHNGALIVAGGSWFPAPKWAGGAKVWVSHVFVLESLEAEWRKFELPHTLAYGGSVSHHRGLLLTGGGDARRNFPSCAWLRWNGRSIEFESAAPLPLPLANCAAAELHGRAYVFGGQSSPQATSAERGLYSLDLNARAPEWRAEPPLPAPERILPSMASVAGSICVAGGAELHPGPGGGAVRTYLRDAWQFTPGAGWRVLPDLPVASCAAPAFSSNGELFVLGGSDGALAAREDELRAAHPGFSRSVYALNPKRGTWRVAAQLPFSLVTTTPVVWNGLLVLPGGEDRPAHRSAAVYGLELKETGA